MTRLALLFTALLMSSACGGPTGPDAGSIQAIIDNASPTFTVNGAAIQAGTTITAGIGTSIVYRVDYRNESGQTFHNGILFVRDDGQERLTQCGATGSGGEGGSFGSSISIFPNDTMFAPGRTVRVVLLGALGPNVSGPGQCYLQLSQGVPNHANVQAQRLLLTIVVQ